MRHPKLKTLIGFCALVIGFAAIAAPEKTQSASKEPTDANALSTKVVVNIKHEGKSYYVPVTAYLSQNKVTANQADDPEKQAAYVTRILVQNAETLATVTEGFKHYGDVRLYLDVSYDPGPDAHIHSPKGRVHAMKICGRICCTNSDGKQCCSVIICPGNCEC